MILVIGGTDYIGRHIVREIRTKQYRVVVLGKTTANYQDEIDHKVVFERCDFHNIEDLDLIFSRYSIEAVVYCKKDDKDSMVGLIHKMLEYKVGYFIFSEEIVSMHMSYKNLMMEKYKQYSIGLGGNNLTAEQMLEGFYKAYNLRYVLMRYCNIQGNGMSKGYNFIPAMFVSSNTQLGKFWDKGYITMKKDSIHIVDIAEAHTLALSYLLSE